MPIFGDLSDDLIYAVGLNCIPHEFKQNEVVLAHGSIPQHLCLIIKGSILVVDDKNILAVMSKGASFGEVGILIDAKQTNSIKAEDKSILCMLKKEDLSLLMERYPDIHECVTKAKNEKNELYHKSQTDSGPENISSKVEQFDWEISQQHLTKVSFDI
jgi:signal-transduction protein with cAMP-binding, CBS, and nucleotidyltransferase domain